MVQRFEKASPVGRVGEHGEFADLAAYLVWLRGAGMFSCLSGLSENEWQEMRSRKNF